MNTAKENAAAIIASVKELAAHAQRDTDRVAVLTIVMVDGEMQVAAAGSVVELTKLAARAIAADTNIETVLSSAVAAAPLMKLFDEGACDCELCQAKAVRKPVNPNVN